MRVQQVKECYGVGLPSRDMLSGFLKPIEKNRILGNERGGELGEYGISASKRNRVSRVCEDSMEATNP